MNDSNATSPAARHSGRLRVAALGLVLLAVAAALIGFGVRDLLPYLAADARPFRLAVGLAGAAFGIGLAATLGAMLARTLARGHHP